MVEKVTLRTPPMSRALEPIGKNWRDVAFLVWVLGICGSPVGASVGVQLIAEELSVSDGVGAFIGLVLLLGIVLTITTAIHAGVPRLQRRRAHMREGIDPLYLAYVQRPWATSEGEPRVVWAKVRGGVPVVQLLRFSQITHGDAEASAVVEDERVLDVDADAEMVAIVVAELSDVARTAEERSHVERCEQIEHRRMMQLSTRERHDEEQRRQEEQHEAAARVVEIARHAVQ